VDASGAGIDTRIALEARTVSCGHNHCVARLIGAHELGEFLSKSEVPSCAPASPPRLKLATAGSCRILSAISKNELSPEDDVAILKIHLGSGAKH